MSTDALESQTGWLGIARPTWRSPARQLRLSRADAVDAIDVLVLAGLLVGTLCYLALTIERGAQPYEDAAIVMRYARHIADGHGIVWNIGEHPVDGATDFLFMWLLTGLASVGIGIEAGARLIGAASHVLTIGLVYTAIRRLHSGSRAVAAASAAYLAVGPATAYIAAAFGTPLFGLLATITWICATRLAQRVTPGMCWAFAMSGLVLGLDRPEGVLLSGLTLLAILYAREWNDGPQIIVPFVAVFTILGGAYFIWHWRYFGYFLPNPFYKKGGGSIYWGSLRASFTNVVLMVGPFWLPFILALRSKAAVRKALFAAIPVCGFAACWVALSDEMNMFARFQYAILPMVLIAWPSVVAGLSTEWKLPGRSCWNLRQRRAAALAIVCGVLGLLAAQRWRYSVPFMQDGRYAEALMLRDYRDRGYAMAVSEAGLLPFYSGWTTLDTWGLNDAWIAHNGSLSPEYLDRAKPELIMFNGPGLLFQDRSSQADGSWGAMVNVLQQYAHDHNYELAAVFSVNPYTGHYYYVKRDFADADQIIARLRSTTYRWRGSSRPAVNFLEYGSKSSSWSPVATGQRVHPGEPLTRAAADGLALRPDAP